MDVIFKVKLRYGFISNSSSCSFIIATQMDLNKSILTKKLFQYFRNQANCMRMGIINELAKYFLNFDYEFNSLENKDEFELTYPSKIKNRGFSHFYFGEIVTEVFFYDLRIPDSYYGIYIEIDDTDFYLLIEPI